MGSVQTEGRVMQKPSVAGVAGRSEEQQGGKPGQSRASQREKSEDGRKEVMGSEIIKEL